MRKRNRSLVSFYLVFVGFGLLFAGTGAAFAAGTAASSFGSSAYSAGVPVNVSITVSPDGGTQAYTTEDRPPNGWTVSQIGGGGVFAGGVVRWGPFFDASQRTLTYQAVPPAGASGTVVFSGSASFDGQSVAVGGTRSLSAAQTSTGNCVSSTTRLCLSGNRFGVEIDWQIPSGEQGVGITVPMTVDSGLFWFFEPTNLEVLIKVLDVCSFSPDHWVFFAATTDVKYTLTVTDTQTGAIKQYFNPQGERAQAVADTAAFPCP